MFDGDTYRCHLVGGKLGITRYYIQIKAIASRDSGINELRCTQKYLPNAKIMMTASTQFKPRPRLSSTHGILVVEAYTRRSRKKTKEALWFMNFIKGDRISCPTLLRGKIR